MFLFILESIGTSELLLIGIVALIFLGPRRMPEIARKVGKMMSEFRGTANEFKDTWRREVDFEEEKKALDLNALESEPVERVQKTVTVTETITEVVTVRPEIREVGPEELKKLKASALEQSVQASPIPEADDPNDKRNWL